MYTAFHDVLERRADSTTAAMPKVTSWCFTSAHHQHMPCQRLYLRRTLASAESALRKTFATAQSMQVGNARRRALRAVSHTRGSRSRPSSCSPPSSRRCRRGARGLPRAPGRGGARARGGPRRGRARRGAYVRQRLVFKPRMRVCQAPKAPQKTVCEDPRATMPRGDRKIRARCPGNGRPSVRRGGGAGRRGGRLRARSRRRGGRRGGGGAGCRGGARRGRGRRRRLPPAGLDAVACIEAR